MQKQVFEKKFGKIQNDYKTGNLSWATNDFTAKHGIDHSSQPEYVWHIVQNFAKLDENLFDVDAVRNMLKYIGMEKRRSVRDYYMEVLSERLFWTHMRFDIEDFLTNVCTVSLLTQGQKDAAVKVLKTYIAGCKKFGYAQRFIACDDVWSLIKVYGGFKADVKSIPDTKQLHAKKVVLKKLILAKAK
ncbi:MAG: hypothetical protein K5912_01070 [Alphaproteobacteria bacterium]|nr:hypothetical protein [Alphaproteobacteria bacterium]